ncbi:MAG: NUDIX hydrolase [Patescibacteria group bacterium]
MEVLSIPGVGGILEKQIDGTEYILIQERWKEEAPNETGLIEIPAGKIRAFENIFDCLCREIKEETGLDIVKINEEDESQIIELNGYKVLNYHPFSCSQNIMGNYPVMVQVFICKVKGEVIKESNETKNLRWISIKDLKRKLETEKDKFYPMHVKTLEDYIIYKGY